jgi:hypothetical protein
VVEVAPAIRVPFLYHWYVRVPGPLAITLKTAVCPALTVWFAGGVVIVGAVFTVNVAGPPVADPAVVVTVTVKREPLSPITVAGVV